VKVSNGLIGINTISVDNFSNKGHNLIAARAEGRIVILSIFVGIMDSSRDFIDVLGRSHFLIFPRNYDVIIWVSLTSVYI
jgi:hypothetical protein